MYKIATIIGARPQFVKAAVVSRVMRGRCNEVIVHTGQHYDYELSGAFFDQLEIPEPNYNLEVGSSTHARQTGEMMAKLEDVLLAEKPDLVQLYGDTNSTLAGALTAVKLCLPISHVEAGPRNFSLRIPEEPNRIVADRFSALCFAATLESVANLEREGIREGVIFSGDVMLDLFLQTRERVRATLPLPEGLEPGRYVLATVHRPRNTDVDERLMAIFGAFLEMEEPVVLPLHPRAVKNLKRAGWYDRLVEAPHVHVLPPQGYLDFQRLELDARMIFTDSGGVQREAYFAKVPCATLFHNTAWPDTVEAGWNTCVDADRQKILDTVKGFAPPASQRSVFGEGNAGEIIVDETIKFLDDPRPIYV